MNESTRRVVRTVLQVLMGLAVLAPVLVREAGLDPSQLPWLAVALAVAAAVTRVMQIPQVQQFLAMFGLDTSDGRHEAGRAGDVPPDAGSVRPLAMALPVALLLGFVLTGPAVAVVAHERRTERPGPLYVGVWTARVCTGLLEVGYGTERLRGGVWEVVPDSWGAEVQLHYVGNGAAPGGQWETVPGIHRTEGNVSAQVAGLPTWDSVRVAVTEDDGAVVASSGRTPSGCPE